MTESRSKLIYRRIPLSRYFKVDESEQQQPPFYILAIDLQDQKQQSSEVKDEPKPTRPYLEQRLRNEPKEDVSRLPFQTSASRSSLYGGVPDPGEYHIPSSIRNIYQMAEEFYRNFQNENRVGRKNLDGLYNIPRGPPNQKLERTHQDSDFGRRFYHTEMPPRHNLSPGKFTSSKRLLNTSRILPFQKRCSSAMNCYPTDVCPASRLTTLSYHQGIARHCNQQTDSYSLVNTSRPSSMSSSIDENGIIDQIAKERILNTYWKEHIARLKRRQKQKLKDIRMQRKTLLKRRLASTKELKRNVTKRKDDSKLKEFKTDSVNRKKRDDYSTNGTISGLESNDGQSEVGPIMSQHALSDYDDTASGRNVRENEESSDGQDTGLENDYDDLLRHKTLKGANDISKGLMARNELLKDKTRRERKERYERYIGSKHSPKISKGKVGYLEQLERLHKIGEKAWENISGLQKRQQPKCHRSTNNVLDVYRNQVASFYCVRPGERFTQNRRLDNEGGNEYYWDYRGSNRRLASFPGEEHVGRRSLKFAQSNYDKLTDWMITDVSDVETERDADTSHMHKSKKKPRESSGQPLQRNRQFKNDLRQSDNSTTGDMVDTAFSGLRRRKKNSSIGEVEDNDVEMELGYDDVDSTTTSSMFSSSDGSESDKSRDCGLMEEEVRQALRDKKRILNVYRACQTGWRAGGNTRSFDISKNHKKETSSHKNGVFKLNEQQKRYTSEYNQKRQVKGRQHLERTNSERMGKVSSKKVFQKSTLTYKGVKREENVQKLREKAKAKLTNDDIFDKDDFGNREDSSDYDDSGESDDSDEFHEDECDPDRGIYHPIWDSFLNHQEKQCRRKRATSLQMAAFSDSEDRSENDSHKLARCQFRKTNQGQPKHNAKIVQPIQDKTERKSNQDHGRNMAFQRKFKNICDEPAIVGGSEPTVELVGSKRWKMLDDMPWRPMGHEKSKTIVKNECSGDVTDEDESRIDLSENGGERDSIHGQQQNCQVVKHHNRWLVCSSRDSDVNRTVGAVKCRTAKGAKDQSNAISRNDTAVACSCNGTATATRVRVSNKQNKEGNTEFGVEEKEIDNFESADKNPRETIAGRIEVEDNKIFTEERTSGNSTCNTEKPLENPVKNSEETTKGELFKIGKGEKILSNTISSGGEKARMVSITEDEYNRLLRGQCLTKEAHNNSQMNQGSFPGQKPEDANSQRSGSSKLQETSTGTRDGSLESTAKRKKLQSVGNKLQKKSKAQKDDTRRASLRQKDKKTTLNSGSKRSRRKSQNDDSSGKNSGNPNGSVGTESDATHTNDTLEGSTLSSIPENAPTGTSKEHAAGLHQPLKEPAVDFQLGLLGEQKAQKMVNTKIAKRPTKIKG